MTTLNQLARIKKLESRFELHLLANFRFVQWVQVGANDSRNGTIEHEGIGGTAIKSLYIFTEDLAQYYKMKDKLTESFVMLEC